MSRIVTFFSSLGTALSTNTRSVVIKKKKYHQVCESTAVVGSARAVEGVMRVRMTGFVYYDTRYTLHERGMAPLHVLFVSVLLRARIYRASVQSVETDGWYVWQRFSPLTTTVKRITI